MVLNERREQDKVFGLLLTLNLSYNDLIKHLLRADTLPSLEEVCNKIQKEQGSLGLFGGKGELISANKAIYNKGGQNRGERRAFCDHCKREGHTKDKCWVLHPHLKPEWMNTPKPSFKPKWTNTPRANTSQEVSHEAKASTSNEGEGKALAASQQEFVKKSDLDALIKALKESNSSGIAFGNSFSSQALNSSKTLIVDSGASHHMISDKKLIDNLEPALGDVIIANGDKIPIMGIGNLKLFDRESKAFYMPNFTSNLLSVKRATSDLNCYAIFGPNEVYFQDIETSKVLGKGVTKNDLYVLEDMQHDSPLSTAFNSCLNKANSAIWHSRLGHPHARALELLLPSVSFKNDECEACILGKHCKSVFPKSSTIYEHCFDLIHSDVWTSPCASRENHKYFVTFIDQKWKYTWVTLLPIEKMKRRRRMVEHMQAAKWTRPRALDHRPLNQHLLTKSI